MSVFTPVSPADLEPWLSHYAIGHLSELQGISAGVQNSNFFVTTTLGRYVLTLFEGMSRAELPYYLHLMAHLARHGLPVPAPIANLDNEYLTSLCERPAALVMRLAGDSEMAPSPLHCERLGAMLAGLHLAGQSYGRRQENPRGRPWRAQTAQAVRPFLETADVHLLEQLLALDAAHDGTSLPGGPIHADLFRDNVLWDGERIGGVIDFYFAGHDAWLFDVAVCVNDWCGNEDGSLDPQRYAALVSAYAHERPFTTAELEAWPVMLQRAALRFWLSRLADFHLPRPGEMVLVKDPGQYRAILLQRGQTAPALPRH